MILWGYFTSFYIILRRGDGVTAGGFWNRRTKSWIAGLSHDTLHHRVHHRNHSWKFRAEISRIKKATGPQRLSLSENRVYIYIYIHIYIHIYIYIYSIHLIPFNPNNPTSNDNGPDKLWPSASFGNGSTRFFSQWLYEAPPSADASGISSDLERILRLHNLGVVTYFHTKFGILVSYVKIVKDS